MNARVLIAAASLPALALVAVVYFSSVSDAPESLTLPEPADDAMATDGTVPDWVREPLRFDDAANIAIDVAAAVERDRQAIIAAGAAAEARLRSDIAATIERRRLSGRSEESERQAAMLEQYQRDPAWPVIPALPGINGFPIRVCPEFLVCLSDRLAREDDDPAWARPMESRLLAEVAKNSGDGLSQVHVVCRRTVCGVLLPSPPGLARPNIARLASRIAPALGFDATRITELDDFQAIYLTTDKDLSPFGFTQ